MIKIRQLEHKNSGVGWGARRPSSSTRYVQERVRPTALDRIVLPALTASSSRLIEKQQEHLLLQRVLAAGRALELRAGDLADKTDIFADGGKGALDFIRGRLSGSLAGSLLRAPPSTPPLPFCPRSHRLCSVQLVIHLQDHQRRWSVLARYPRGICSLKAEPAPLFVWSQHRNQRPLNRISQIRNEVIRTRRTTACVLRAQRRLRRTSLCREWSGWPSPRTKASPGRQWTRVDSLRLDDMTNGCALVILTLR